MGAEFVGADLVSLGKVLQRRRREAGLTQADLAADLVSTGYVSRVEAGTRAPSGRVLAHFAATLGTTPLQLRMEALGGGRFERRPDLSTAVARATATWLEDPTDPTSYAHMINVVELWREAEKSTDRSFDVDAAARLAHEAHAGQVDKQGRQYFTGHLEPIARALLPFGDEAAMAGYLHDILEDTSWSAEQLEEAGVPAEVVAAVVAVTRVPGEAYEDLIERARAHRLGRLVKLADNALNVASNPGLAATDPITARRMLQDRYLPARARLLEGLVDGPQVLALIQSGLPGT